MCIRDRIPQIGVESDMSVFMGECHAQAILPVLVPGQRSRDFNTRFPAGLKMREPLDIAAIAGQVRELVEGLGVALDAVRSSVETGYFATPCRSLRKPAMMFS